VIATRSGFAECRKRRVFAVEDMTDEQIAAIEKAQMPPGHEHLDAELKDWRDIDSPAGGLSGPDLPYAV
jgi:hypothetical protein